MVARHLGRTARSTKESNLFGRLGHMDACASSGPKNVAGVQTTTELNNFFHRP